MDPYLLDDVAVKDYRAIFASAPGLFLLIRANPPHYTIVAASNAFLRATEARLEDLMGHALFQAFPPPPDEIGAPPHSGWRESLSRVVNQRTTDVVSQQRDDVRIRTAQGVSIEERWWRFEHSPLLSADGTLGFILHSRQAITKSIQQAPARVRPPRHAAEAAPLDATAPRASHGTLEQLKTLIQNAPISMAIFDRSMRYLAVSDRWQRDYGRGHTHLIGQNHYELFPELPGFWKKIHERVLSGETVRCDGVPIKIEDGGTRWLSFSQIPWFDESGEIAGLIVSGEDLTEGKRIEEELHAKRLQLEAVLESMADAVLISDAAGQLVSFNQALATFHRFKDKKEFARNYAEYAATFEVLSADGSLVPFDRWAVPRALKGDSETHAEYSIRRKDTKEKWIGSFNFAPIRNSEGVICGAIVTASDITKQKLAEQALRESQHKYEVLFERSPIGNALVKVPERIYSEVNDTFLHIIGYTREELLHQSPIELEILDASSQTPLNDILFPVRQLREFECILKTKKGELRNISLYLDSIEIGGQLHALVGMRDLTEQKQAEEKARLYERTVALDMLKSKFFASVSHELRTPLTLIQGPAQHLLQASDISDAARQDLEIIVRNAFSLERLVDQLLATAQLEAGRLVLQYRQTNLSFLVESIARQFQVLAYEKRINYEIQTRDELLAEVDPDRLEQILLNLISNAFKFTPVGGQIRLSLHAAEHDRVILEIGDSGPGIPLNQRQKVFERFYQNEHQAARRFGGAGLGLSIARELTMLHHGTIAIADAPEGGTLFIVNLPRKAPPATRVRRGDPDAGSVQNKQADRAIADLRAISPRISCMGKSTGPLVLIVEDNCEMALYIAQGLQDRYRIAGASDGMEGLTKARALKPDVLIVDLMMPTMSGEEMIADIRARFELNATAIV